MRDLWTLTLLGALLLALLVLAACQVSRPVSAAPAPREQVYCNEVWFYEVGEPLPHLACWSGGR